MAHYKKAPKRKRQQELKRKELRS